MADYIPQFLPATAKDWQYARPDESGGLVYTRDNPAWSAEQLRLALEHQAYLQSLMERQRGLSLSGSRVGKGMTTNPSEQPALFPMMRGLSQFFLGQPYGMLAPPTTDDVDAANQRVQGLLGAGR